MIFTNHKFLRAIAKGLLVAVMATQVFGAVLLVNPKTASADIPINPASAGLGKVGAAVGVPTFGIFDSHKYVDQIFTNIMLGIAYAFTQHFMQRFVNKLTEKYKIRNFLYYDQVLSNYYLTNFIRDKIGDPDLREIYTLLESEYIYGQPNGTTPGSSGISPGQALVPRFKKAVSDLYIKRTGVDPKVIAYPPATLSNRDYLSKAQYYYFNPTSYTETNLRAQFGAFQSSATTASQLEVLVGNSLKAGRYIGGKCDAQIINESSGKSSSIGTKQTCEANGGRWQESALDKARSFIDNPSGYVETWMQSAVKEIAGANFDPNNFWFAIGNAFGRYLTNNFLLDKQNGTLNEDTQNGYNPTDSEFGSGTTANPTQIDTDGDGVSDGFDNDNDGIIDYCIFGGTAPNCNNSSGTIGGGGEETNPGAPAPVDASIRHPSRRDVVVNVIGQLQAQGINLSGDCGAFEITKAVAWELRSEGAGLVASSGAGSCQGYSADKIMYQDGYVYDILGKAGQVPGNVPQWLPLAAVDPSLWRAPLNPNPTCPSSHPLFNLMLVLKDIKDEVSRWNPEGPRVGDMNITEFGLQDMIDSIEDINDQLGSYRTEVNEIKDAFRAIKLMMSIGDLSRSVHLLSPVEKAAFTQYKSNILSKTISLISRVGDECN